MGQPWKSFLMPKRLCSISMLPMPPLGTHSNKLKGFENGCDMALLVVALIF